MKRLGRRALRDQRKLAEGSRKAETMVRDAASASGVSEEHLRERMLEVARVRAEMIDRLEGTGMRVSDVVYDPKTDRIEVRVRPIDVEVKARAIGSTFDRVKFERDLAAEGRTRVALIEIEQAFGEPRCSLRALVIGLK